jgi:hypothetical protein
MKLDLISESFRAFHRDRHPGLPESQRRIPTFQNGCHNENFRKILL